ncbi:uncharacterized protein [Dysidea avara]|uniref:uncharacterized protein isoform X3 n=1 Tax=Dysidea avara TaxID=196820 RepID=UPI00331DCE2B
MFTTRTTSTGLVNIILVCLLLFGLLTGFCESQVTITTEPSNVTVSTGEVAVFTCTLMVSTNIEDRYIMWKRFDDMGNNITLASTGHYMISNDLTVSDIINSTLTITDVRLEHAGVYQFEILNYIRSSKVFLNVDSPIITTQPSDVTVCTGVVAKFICKIDRNGRTGIGIDDVLWQQLRSDSISNISSGLHPFSITTTISSDILTSTLTISDVRCAHNGSYRCIVPDVMTRYVMSRYVMSRYVMSRYASLIVIGTKPSTPILLVSNITGTSFVVQWDEVNGADYYIVNWRGGSNVRESISQTSITITQLSPNTTYNVTVTAGNICGSGIVSDILIVTTNSTILVGPSISSSVMTTTSSISSMVAMATTTTLSSSMMNTSPISSMTAMSTVSMAIPTSLSLVMSNTLSALSLATPTASNSGGGVGGGGGGAGSNIGGVVGGIIAVIVVIIIIIVVLCWFCVYKKKKKGGSNLEKEKYKALRSPTGKFAQTEDMERPYITVDTSVVPYQILPNRVEYAVSSKHVSMVSGDDSPPDYSYIMLEEKKNVPDQTSASGEEYPVSTNPEKNKYSHYDEIEIKDESTNVPLQTSASGAEYAVSTRGKADDVKDKTPQGHTEDIPDTHTASTTAAEAKDTHDTIRDEARHIPNMQHAASTTTTEAKYSHYDVIREEPRNIPHLTTASGAKYAVSTKAKAHQNDNENGKTPQGHTEGIPATYPVSTKPKKAKFSHYDEIKDEPTRIEGIPATHPVSTKPKKAKFSHYDEIKDEPGHIEDIPDMQHAVPTTATGAEFSHYDVIREEPRNVRHLTTASGAKYAVSTKAKAHQTDNEKGKTPQGHTEGIPSTHPVSTKPKKAKFSHYDEIKDEPGHIEDIPDMQHAVPTTTTGAEYSHYDVIREEPRNVPHLTTASGAKYAVSTKAKAHQTDNEKDKTPQGHIEGIPATHPVSTKPKKAKFSHYDEIQDEPGHIDGIPATHPVSTKPKKAKFSHYDEIKDEPGDMQHAVSTTATEAKDPHYDTIREEPRNVPHRTSASGAESAVSTKLKAHQQDDVKDKTPQGISHSEIQNEPEVSVTLDSNPVVRYTQI